MERDSDEATTMKKWLLAVTVLAALGIIGFLALRMFTPPPDNLDLSREMMSQAGIYRVAVAPEAEPIPQGPLHSWIVTVALPDGSPVEDATIGVDGGMPQHGHGLPTAPQASGHLGEGRYRVEGMRFNMGGWWVLRLAIASPAGEDSAEFNIRL